MQIETTFNRIPVIKVTGEIDHFYAPRFEAKLIRLIDKNPGNSIAINLSGVEYLDSGAIGVLFAIAKTLKKKSPGKKIILICPNKNIKKIIQLVGVTNNPAFLVIDHWKRKVIEEAK